MGEHSKSLKNTRLTARPVWVYCVYKPIDLLIFEVQLTRINRCILDVILSNIAIVRCIRCVGHCIFYGMLSKSYETNPLVYHLNIPGIKGRGIYGENTLK